MLDKDLFKQKINELLVSFPNWKIKYDDPFTMKLWYSKFEDMEDEHFYYMIDKYIENETFNPTIAGLKSWDIAPRKSRDQIKHEQMVREMGLFND